MSWWASAGPRRRTLAGQLVGLLISVALASSAAMMAFVGLYRLQVIDDGTARLYLTEVGAARALLEAAPERDVPRVLGIFAERGFEIRTTPPVDADEQAPYWLRPFAYKLAGMAPAGIVFRWQAGTEPVVWAGFEMRRRPYWLPFYLTRTEGGVRPIVVWLILLAGIVGITALSATRLLTVPLRQLRDAVETADTDQTAIDLDPRLPAEVREIGERFDALLGNERARLKERELLLAGVAHDLRTPVTRLRLRAELIDDKDEREATRRDVALLTRMIDRFLDAARGMSDATGKTVDAGALLRDALAGKGDVTLIDQLEGAVLPLAPDAFVRIACNLVENAHEHGRAPVTVVLNAQGERVVLSVSDAGAGIPSTMWHQLLQPFTRREQERAASGNLGLGLSIVDHIVRETGGVLDAKQESGGFTVSASWPHI